MLYMKYFEWETGYIECLDPWYISYVTHNGRWISARSGRAVLSRSLTGSFVHEYLQHPLSTYVQQS